MPARQAAPCLKCGQMIEVNEAAFVIDIRVRTVGVVGIAESSRASQASVSCCITCADLMARGDEPPARTRPLDHVVYEQVQSMVLDDPTVAFLSWIEMRKTLNLPAPRLDDPKTLNLWNDFRKTMALPPVIERESREIGEGKRLRAG